MNKSMVKQILELECKSIQELRKIHTNLFMENASSILSREYLSRKIAYRIQELAIGGLDAKSKAKLAEISDLGSKKRNHIDLLPGTKICKEYNDVMHEVEVTEDGFEYNGQKWSSLSAIATRITGTKWNGQKFFGFRKK